MTTAVSPSLDWIRLTIDGDEVTLAPSPGFWVRLLVTPVPYDGYLDPLAAPPPPQIRFTVDLVPTGVEPVARCETEARRVARALAEAHATGGLLSEFSLEAALSGEGLPYNRVSAARLRLATVGPPAYDEDQAVPSVRVFAATAHADGVGSKYQMRIVD